jgi:hypothetical protein
MCHTGLKGWCPYGSDTEELATEDGIMLSANTCITMHFHVREELCTSYYNCLIISSHSCSAVARIKSLEEEVKRNQQMALKYRDMYEQAQYDELSSPRDAHSLNTYMGQLSNRSSNRLKPAPLDTQSFIGPATSVNDVVRKNEVRG